MGPGAREVRLVGDFNSWCGEGFKLTRWNREGVWTIVIDEDLRGCLYKYEIITHNGERF